MVEPSIKCFPNTSPNGILERATAWFANRCLVESVYAADLRKLVSDTNSVCALSHWSDDNGLLQ